MTKQTQSHKRAHQAAPVRHAMQSSDGVSKTQFSKGHQLSELSSVIHAAQGLSSGQTVAQPVDLAVPQPMSVAQAKPELLNWVADQFRRGVHGQAVHEVLVRSGLQPAYADQVMQQVVAVAFPGFARNPGVAQTHPTPIPEPLLDSGSTVLDLGDRRGEIVMTLMFPRVIVIDGFLSDAECDGMIEAAKPRMERSTVVQQATGASEVNDVRTSTGMFFGIGENEIVARVEARIARTFHWPVENGEGLQVLNYKPGAEYKPHQDFFDSMDPGSAVQLGLAGQRLSSIVMYLNTPVRGGGTVFPDAGGMEVRAKKGRVVIFSYAMASPAAKALHGGAPVIEGEKWAATKWLRRASLVQGLPFTV